MTTGRRETLGYFNEAVLFLEEERRRLKWVEVLKTAYMMLAVNHAFAYYVARPEDLPAFFAMLGFIGAVLLLDIADHLRHRAATRRILSEAESKSEARTSE